jgi:hypothetical protein
VTMEVYASASSAATREALKRLGASLDGQDALPYFAAVRAKRGVATGQKPEHGLLLCALRLSGWRDSNPRPLRPKLRARRSIGVVSARHRSLAGVLGRCWSVSLLYFAAVQLRSRAGRD